MLRVVLSVLMMIMALATTAQAGAPALCPSNAAAMCRPAPCTTMPASVSRITGFDPVCRQVLPCIRGEVPCITPCNTWQPLGPGVWVNGAWVEESVVVPISADGPAPVTTGQDDQAFVDLRHRRYRAAAMEFLRRHEARVLEEANAEGGAVPNRSWLRLHALSLAGAGDFSGAARAFAQAYAEDPVLVGDPIDGARVMGSTVELRRILIGGVRYAHRSNSPEAWYAVGYLMEAERRFARAQAMFERADALN